MWYASDEKLTAGNRLAFSAIRCCLVDTASDFIESSVFPNNCSTSRCGPSLLRLFSVEFAVLVSTMTTLRLPLSLLPCFRFRRSAVPLSDAFFFSFLHQCLKHWTHDGLVYSGFAAGDHPFLRAEILALTGSWGFPYAFALLSDAGRVTAAMSLSTAVMLPPQTQRRRPQRCARFRRSITRLLHLSPTLRPSSCPLNRKADFRLLTKLYRGGFQPPGAPSTSFKLAFAFYSDAPGFACRDGLLSRVSGMRMYT